MAAAGRMGERVLLTLWIGSVWAVGYIVAPVLFAQLEQPRLAGTIAGELFTLSAYLGLVCGSLLLVFQCLRPQPLRNWRAWLIGGMVLLTAIGEFSVRALMREASGADFGRLHGIAQILFFCVSVAGLVLVAAGVRPEGRAER